MIFIKHSMFLKTPMMIVVQDENANKTHGSFIRIQNNIYFYLKKTLYLKNIHN